VKYIKEETGVMLVKDGKAWQETYDDGRSKEFGFGDIHNAELRDQRYVMLPLDFTWPGSHYVKEVCKGDVVKVKRTVIIEVLD